jgi:hypothetical protein
MKKFELLILGISIGITGAISTLFGFAGSSLFGSFWSWFWISALVQVVLFVGVNSFLIQKERTTSENLAVRALEQFSKFTIKIYCSYCQQPNITPIQLNQKNTFKCESCNQVNSIAMQFTATPLTTPVTSIETNIESVEIKSSAAQMI